MGANLARSLTGAAPPPKQVSITKAGDFPDPVGDVITLEPDTLYVILGTVDITPNCIDMNTNTVIQGRTYPEAGIDVLQTTSTTCVVRAAVDDMLLRNVSIVQNGSGIALEADEPTAFHQIEETFVTGGLRLISGNLSATFSTFFGPGIIVDEDYANPAGGLAIENVSFQTTGAGSSGFSMEVGAVAGFVNILSTAFIAGPLADWINVDSPDQVVVSARVENGAFIAAGGGGVVGVDTPANDTWRFRNQSGQTDSHDRVAVRMDAPSGPEVDLPNDGSWTDIADGGVDIVHVEAASEKIRLTDTNTGEVTIGGPPTDQRVYTASLSVTSERASGNNDFTLEIGLSVNGLDPEAFCSVSGAAWGRRTQSTLAACVMPLANGDTVKPVIRNAQNNANVDVYGVKFVIQE